MCLAMTVSLLTHNKERCSQEEQHLKRRILRELQKTGTDDADMMRCDRPSEKQAAATGQARSLTVDSHIQWMINDSI